MADDVEMTPVEMTPVAAEPPKVNPLASEAKTLKMAPPIRKPVAGAPGLKLPPKPAIGAGVKLPPKPGLATGGLKLPPKPAIGAGIKLPPKPAIGGAPTIRKPGATISAKPLPKPVLPKPIAPTAASTEAKIVDNPVAAPFTKAAETAPAAPVAEAPTPATPPTPAPLDALKSVTQKLKGVTQQIPAQAILHKTGIIADAEQSEAQKEAAKHKTARISLSDAIGVAPVKSEPAPMKTIRIKRPIDVAAKPAAAPTPAAPVASSDTAEAPVSETSMTQRKTLKIQRPGASVRPAGKFAVKKPVAPPAASSASPESKPAEGGDVPEIADIPDIPAVTPVTAEAVSDLPSWFTGLSAAVALAACGVVGALAYYLYENAQLATFCGGLGWGA